MVRDKAGNVGIAQATWEVDESGTRHKEGVCTDQAATDPLRVEDALPYRSRSVLVCSIHVR